MNTFGAMIFCKQYCHSADHIENKILMTTIIEENLKVHFLFFHKCNEKNPYF